MYIKLELNPVNCTSTPHLTLPPGPAPHLHPQPWPRAFHATILTSIMPKCRRWVTVVFTYLAIISSPEKSPLRYTPEYPGTPLAVPTFNWGFINFDRFYKYLNVRKFPKTPRTLSPRISPTSERSSGISEICGNGRDTLKVSVTGSMAPGTFEGCDHHILCPLTFHPSSCQNSHSIFQWYHCNWTTKPRKLMRSQCAWSGDNIG